MGSAGTIIQWILQLGPLVESFFQMIIDAFKKKPAPTPAPGEELAAEGLSAPSMSTVLAFVMHLLPSIMPLVEDGIALAKAEPGVLLPQEVKDKAGQSAKLFADAAHALSGLDALASTVKVLQEMSDVLAALAA